MATPRPPGAPGYAAQPRAACGRASEAMGRAHGRGAKPARAGGAWLRCSRPLAERREWLQARRVRDRAGEAPQVEILNGSVRHAAAPAPPSSAPAPPSAPAAPEAAPPGQGRWGRHRRRGRERPRAPPRGERGSGPAARAAACIQRHGATACRAEGARQDGIGSAVIRRAERRRVARPRTRVQAVHATPGRPQQPAVARGSGARGHTMQRAWQ